MSMINRRSLMTVGSGLLLAGCDKLVQSPGLVSVVQSAEQATYRWQRLIGRDALAKEFTKADLSPDFKVNGTREPREDAYQALAANGFADWKLRIDGLVDRPTDVSLAELRRLPARTQITRHDCVEGWSAIGEWSGPQLGTLLKTVGLKPNARYIVFHCADNYGGEQSKGGAQSSGIYYESIDLVDAFHPQTIVALSMNGGPLSVGHGAPARMRIERQLGYKQAKYVMRIEAVNSFKGLELGRGGYWEDRGYEWYAGI
ncbi:molybdopterin-binding protein [Glacieibacterium sp.]|uniref:molybdopterin-binding protein n=1 Tax=Glacieibacterium sp. TaxID=2860237 RepID=UPI003AFF7318